MFKEFKLYLGWNLEVTVFSVKMLKGKNLHLKQAVSYFHSAQVSECFHARVPTQVGQLLAVCLGEAGIGFSFYLVL